MFRSFRDNRSVFSGFVAVVYPEKNVFKNAYGKATNQPYVYLVNDITVTTPNGYRICTNIFPNEDTHTFLYNNKMRELLSIDLFCKKMSRCVQLQYSFLLLVYTTNDIQRIALIKLITVKQLQVLCEIVFNIYKRTIKSSRYFTKKLLPFK